MRDLLASRLVGPLHRGAALLLLMGCLFARAASGALDIEQVWAPPTPPGATVAVVYLRIRNHGPVGDRLLTVDTPIAARVAVHQSHIVGGIMQMREINGVDFAPGAVLDSETGGMHMMLMGVTQALELGSHFPLSLHFRNAGTILVSVTVKAAQ